MTTKNPNTEFTFKEKILIIKITICFALVLFLLANGYPKNDTIKIRIDEKGIDTQYIMNENN